MSEVFNAVIRPLGSSACVLIPNERLKEQGLKIGDSVDVALLVHRKLDALDKLFGMAKGARPFERDKKVREFE